MRPRFGTLIFLLGLCAGARASTLTVSGTITQSAVDGTGPAVHTPALNDIVDGQSFQVTLASATPINAPGFYDLAGSSLIFSVPGAAASEGNFGAISLSLVQDGGYLDFSVYGCVADADCSIGNALSASFSVPAGSLGGMEVGVIGLDGPHPFELLEDEGITDLHGSISLYSNTALVTTPEPASGVLMATALLGTAALACFQRARLVQGRVL